MTAGGHRKVIHGSAPLPDCWLTPVKGGATVGIQVKQKVVGCNSKQYTGGALQIKRGIIPENFLLLPACTMSRSRSVFELGVEA